MIGFLEEGLFEAANYDKNKETNLEEELAKSDKSKQTQSNPNKSSESQNEEKDLNIPKDEKSHYDIIKTDTEMIDNPEIFENTAKYCLSYVNSALMSNWLENNECPPLNEDQVVESLHYSKFGFPLKIFCENRICFPYCSLHNLETLKSSSTKCYWAGATNQVFKMDTRHYDALVDVFDAIFFP